VCHHEDLRRRERRVQWRDAGEVGGILMKVENCTYSLASTILSRVLMSTARFTVGGVAVGFVACVISTMEMLWSTTGEQPRRVESVHDSPHSLCRNRQHW
jgi:hypothetical protein